MNLLSAEAGFCPCILGDKPHAGFQRKPCLPQCLESGRIHLCCETLTQIVLVNLLKPPYPLSIDWDRISVALQINAPSLAQSYSIYSQKKPMDKNWFGIASCRSGSHFDCLAFCASSRVGVMALRPRDVQEHPCKHHLFLHPALGGLSAWQRD